MKKALVMALITVFLASAIAIAIPSMADASEEGYRNTILGIVGGLLLLGSINRHHERHYAHDYHLYNGYGGPHRAVYQRSYIYCNEFPTSGERAGCRKGQERRERELRRERERRAYDYGYSY